MGGWASLGGGEAGNDIEEQWKYDMMVPRFHLISLLGG